MSEPRKYYLGGTWESSAETVTIRNPFDDSAVEDCSLASAKDANTAVEKAGKGFGASRKLSSAERFEILSGISESIRKEREQFASLMTSEVGKAISLSRGEVDRAVMTFRLAAEEAKRISGEVLPLDLHASSAGRFGVVRRFPIGVVLAISPFNYPLNLVAHKVGPAIASGNAWILKPPPQAPGTSLELARIIEESGFPKEAFSVLPCRNEVAESLVTDDRINMLSFTGSAAVGWNLKSKAGKKKILLELGGNAGVIVDESARIAEAARRNAMGAFVYSGQVCIKVQRIFIHQNVFDRYVEAFLNETKRIVAGDPRKEETMVGPLIDEASASRVLLWVEEARKAGATLLNGGARSGRVIEPTVLLDADRTSRVYCEEVFGPVVTLHRFDTFENAVRMINDSRFGLQAGVFSNDYRNILYAYQTIEAGAVVINDNPTYRIDHMPYGGIKDSGFGREGLKYAIEAMTEPKLLVAA